MRSSLSVLYRSLLAYRCGGMGVFVFSMKCPNCGSDSINWVVCSHCGHRFDERTGPNWMTVTLCIILVIVFLPIGLCGGAFVVASFIRSLNTTAPSLLQRS